MRISDLSSDVCSSDLSASAMSKHGIKLMQFSGAAFQRFHADAGSLSHFSELCLSMRQKFVERRVEQPDCDRKAGHHAENPREIAALLRKLLCQRLPSADRKRTRLNSNH